jgi:hypothetical protein
VPAITATGAGEQFSDADIHAYLGLGGAQPEIDLSEEFNFPDHLMPGPAANAFVLGAPPPPPPVDPYGTGFAVPLCSDLRLRLEELAPTERASRVEELRTMDAEGLTRQNNSARNYYMLNGLGLGDAAKETLWGGSEVPAKRKAAKEGRKKGGKKARKTKDPVEEVSDEDEGSESEDEADQTPAPGPEKTKAKKAPAKPKKAPAGRGGGASAASKAWADTAQLLLAKDDFGAEWASLLGVWWKREERAGFEGTVSNAVDVAVNASVLRDSSNFTFAESGPSCWKAT